MKQDVIPHVLIIAVKTNKRILTHIFRKILDNYIIF